MAGSGGSFENDEIDFDNGEDLNGFASSPPGSSHGSNGYDAAEVFSPSTRRDSFFMTEPEHDNPQDFQSPEEHQNDLDGAEEEEGLGPLKPRGRIIGNGFDRPIHRQTSLAEFENLESLVKDQSHGSSKGDGRFIQDNGGQFHQEGDQFLQENGHYLQDGGQNLDEEGWSDEEGMGYEGGGDHHQSRHFDDGGDIDSTNEGEQFVEEMNRDDGVDDLMKYMQATPRNDQELPSEQMHRLSRVMDISYDNDSLDDRGAGDVNDAIFPQSSSHQDFFSLSQEQIPEQPSHLNSEEEDVSDMFSHDGAHSIQPRENLSTIIKAAAANIETFGSGDSPEGRGADSSGGGIEHFKPIATSNRRPSRPQTAAQLRDQERLNSGQNSASEQTSGSEQSSQGSQGSVRNALSARSQRTRSSRAGTPRSGLSSRSRRSSFESVQSEGGNPSSYRESLGQLTPRSSTPGHDSTLVGQDSEFSPSPVRQDARKTSEVIPRLRLDNISGPSDQRSEVSDVEPLDRTTKSHLVSDDFVDQLQKEYDDLLQKHAQAENTIDSLRLGAKIRLEYEGQPGSQSGRSAVSPFKHGQTINLPHGQKGLMSSADSGLPHTPGMNRIVHVHTSSPGSHRPSIASAGEHQMLPPDASEGELLALQFQVQGHKEQMDSFGILLQENHLSLPDQERGLGGLKSGQTKLETDFMQAKEEHKAKARLGSARGHPVTFDPEQQVEGQIFQLGMRLENIQEAVQENLRRNPPEPWLPTARKAEHHGKAPGIAMATESASQDGGASRRENAQAGPTPEEEYALLLSRYDALKQRAPHPDRDKEIQRLVKSLQDMPDFAVVTDHPDNDGSPGQNGSGYHDNDADIEPEIALIDHRHDVEDDHDHDGDVDGSSVHSSQFREMTSPEVFRPKGTAPHDLPRWQPPVTGSMSSLASPDNEAPPSSIHSRKKSAPGKPNSRQPQPRADSGDTRRGKTSQGAPTGHLEPGEGDSGFVGSESSRQSQKTRLSEGRPKNRSQRLPVSHEVTKDTPSRESRLPVRQHGSNKTPLQGRNGTVPLRQQAVPEEEDSIYSGGSRRMKKQQPQTLQYEQPIRDTRPSVHKSQITPPRTKDSMQHRHQRTPVIPSQKERQPNHNHSLPLSSQYLQRTSNDRDSKTPVPKRRNDQRVEPQPVQGRSDRLQGSSQQRTPSRQQGMTYNQLKMSPWQQGSPRQPEMDRRSDVTRSSVRTEALQALQDEVNQLRSRMADGRRNQTSPPATIPEEGISRSRLPYPVDEDDGGSTRSSKSEMLQMLQEEIAELKNRVVERDPETRTPHVTSTPMRDSMKEALMDRYIPGHSASFGASPIRASPQKFSSRLRHGDMSSIRSPPRIGAGTRSPLWARGSNFAPSSPPPVSGFSGQYQSPAPTYHSRSVPCSSCGGTGTHTHGDYQYPPPPSTYSPAPQQAYTPVQGTPLQTHVYPQSQTMSYVQPPTVSYVQPQTSPTFAPPNVSVLPQNVASATPTHGQSYVYVQSRPAPVPQNASMVPQVTQQTPAASAPQTTLLSGQSQSGTPSNVHPDARPVYLLSSEKRGRYYIRDDATSTSGGEEEFYYRRTPRSGRTRTRTGSRHGTPRPARQPKVVERIPAAFQVTLDDAVHMAERLKRTTNHMMSSMRQDVHLAGSFNT